MRPLDLNEIIAQNHRHSSVHTFGLDRISIVRSLADGLPPVVGDREKLGQVVMNLLTNARDAIGSDGRITVRSRFDRETGEVVVDVADNRGRESLGESRTHFRAVLHNKGVGKGTGLGLFRDFGIVKEHGGRIDR